MPKRKNPNSRPAREPKPPVPVNPLLLPEEQGARYRVCTFALLPELEFLTAEGKVMYRKKAPRALGIFEVDFDKTVRQVMQENRAPMESHPK